MLDIDSQMQNLSSRLKMLILSHSNEFNFTNIDFNKGDKVLVQGTISEDLFILIKGKVNIEVSHASSSSHSLAILEAENILGEMSLFGGSEVSADVVVLSDKAEFIKLKGHELLSSIMFDAELASELLAIVSNRCQNTSKVNALLMDAICALHAKSNVSIDASLEKLRNENEELFHIASMLEEIKTRCK